MTNDNLARTLAQDKRSLSFWWRHFKRINKFAVVTKRQRFGTCPICAKWTLFVHVGNWSREDYRCVRCGSSARARALYYVLKKLVPDMSGQRVIEFAPHGPVSRVISEGCGSYIATVYRPKRPFGTVVDGFRNEDVRSLTFSDGSFDIVISQDVFEHVVDPEAGFSEVARVLAITGFHIFTVPLHLGQEKSMERAKIIDGQLCYVKDPVYHGAPGDEVRALVATDWGDDITDIIEKCTGMRTSVIVPKVPKLGIEGESLEVLVSHRSRGAWSK